MQVWPDRLIQKVLKIRLKNDINIIVDEKIDYERNSHIEIDDTEKSP